MESYEITLINLHSHIESLAKIEVDEAESNDYICITAVINGQTISAAKYGYFEAFQSFRDKVLSIGYGIKCNGSKVNAVQSGMMAACEKIYLVEIGRQALLNQTAIIWDYSDISSFPDSKEQQQFLKKWIYSLKKVETDSQK